MSYLAGRKLRCACCKHSALQAIALTFFRVMLQGLQQHLRASHDLFDYGFAEDNPMRLPAVSVEVSAGLYGPNHTFQSPEAASLGDSVSKVQPQMLSLNSKL